MIFFSRNQRSCLDLNFCAKVFMDGTVFRVSDVTHGFLVLFFFKEYLDLHLELPKNEHIWLHGFCTVIKLQNGDEKSNHMIFNV